MPEPLEVCEAAARAGGRVLREWMGRAAVTAKGPRDLVTEADLAAQAEIRRIVLGAFPDHGFVGEESDPGDPSAVPGAPRWIVDPLDGTTNYVKGYPAWCTSVALAAGEHLLAGAIYDPLRDECFTAGRGAGARLNGAAIRVGPTERLDDALVAVSFPAQVDAGAPAVRDFLAVLPHALAMRRSGSTALNLAAIASGRLDAFWVRRIHPWDVAAGLLLVEEAGGVVRPFAGGPPSTLDRPSFIAAATPRLADALAEVLPPADPAAW
jgi:myo-inositol-1(or 4)-monophosphatase